MPGSKLFKGCFQCGSTDHRKHECPELEAKDSRYKSNRDRSPNQKKSEDRDELELEVKRLKRKLAEISDNAEKLPNKSWPKKNGEFSHNPQVRLRRREEEMALK